MTKDEFCLVLNHTLNYIRQKAQEHPEYYTCVGGESFEPKVVEAVAISLESLKIKAELKYVQGGHAFPDIVIECPDGTKYGIEVKSTKSNQWKINGNSVMGSTSEEGIDETYILFGKLVIGNPEFKIRKYEECISDVAVTHSPRYKIDMDLSTGETFFEKANIPYDVIKNSEDPISLVKDYYRDQGYTAWWLTESAPAVIRLLNELDVNERNIFLSYGFANFPELLSTTSHKYRNFALWLISEHSIAVTNLRDYFSASGQVEMTLCGKVYKKVPKVYKTLFNNRDEVFNIINAQSPESLKERWGFTDVICDAPKDKLNMWISVVTANTMQNNKSQSVDTVQLIKDIFQGI